ncbi:uncharacterized protein [Diadema setosum]|uniref:uncharacterized protein n=1 Tax=Diadema setosum TaxID=31175 RepID=UPI003B3B658A
MDPPKVTHQLENTPNKSSPSTKKPKMSNCSPTACSSRMETNDVAETPGQYDSNMAAPLHGAEPTGNTRRSLDLSSEAPPVWFVTFFKDFESRFDSRIEALLDKKLKDISLKVSDHEEKMNNIEFEVGALKDSVKQLEREKEILVNKLDDLENRGRRKNLVLFGIAESSNPTTEDCMKTVTQFLQYADVPEADLSKIERCHRTPTHQPVGKDGTHFKQARRIHVAFSTFVTKERVRKACIKKLKRTSSMYHDLKVFVAEDLSQRVLQLRRKKQEKFKRVKDEGKRPFFAYPDKIRYIDQTSGKVVSVD